MVTPLTPSVELAVTAPVNVLAPLTLIVPSTTNASLTLIAVESDESNVVPFTLNEPRTTSPVPPGVMLMSAFEDDVMLLSCIVKLSIVVVVRVDAPLTANVLDKVAAPVNANVLDKVAAPDTLAVPSTINASLMLIELESSELKVVPAILRADATTPPVPFGN